MKNISDHAHAMHQGPHYSKYVHADNRMGASKGGDSGLQVEMGKKGSHEIGNESHIDSLIGEPKGADVSGHNGKMHW